MGYAITKAARHVVNGTRVSGYFKSRRASATKAIRAYDIARAKWDYARGLLEYITKLLLASETPVPKPKPVPVGACSSRCVVATGHTELRQNYNGRPDAFAERVCRHADKQLALRRPGPNIV